MRRVILFYHVASMCVYYMGINIPTRVCINFNEANMYVRMVMKKDFAC